VPVQPRRAAGDAQGGFPSDRDLRRPGRCGRRRRGARPVRGTIARAFGIAGSLASGIIEYLADGSSTKRLHAGAAAQAGFRAAHLAQAGFAGPLTVFEGSHGLYKAFAPSKTPDFSKLLDGLGQRWVMETLAFKPYACGTMTQPFVDCALRLAASGVKADDIVAITCKVGEGTVHRLWEPLSEKHNPPNGYAGKFSTPYCMAVAFIDGEAGLGQFTDSGRAILLCASSLPGCPM
jgi:2-methylcitrate dehydratase PrpD